MKLSESLSVLVDAKKHIDKWQSTAEDRDTSELRTAVHFLQRATNSYQAEVHDTQAASLLCGFHASLTSERFVFSAGWDFVRLGLLAREQEFPTYMSDVLGVEVEGSEEEEEDMVQIGRDSEWARQRKEEEFGGMGVPGIAKTYTSRDGSVVPVSMGTHYRFRGEQLARFSAQEYEACIQIVQRTPEEIEEWDAQREAEKVEVGEAVDGEAMEEEEEEEGSEEKPKKKKSGRRANATVSTPPPRNATLEPWMPLLLPCCVLHPHLHSLRPPSTTPHCSLSSLPTTRCTVCATKSCSPSWHAS